MKFCRNVYNNGAIYNEKEQQLWLTYILNYLPYNKIFFSFSNSSAILNILTKPNGGVYIYQVNTLGFYTQVNYHKM